MFIKEGPFLGCMGTITSKGLEQRLGEEVTINRRFTGTLESTRDYANPDMPIVGFHITSYQDYSNKPGGRIVRRHLREGQLVELDYGDRTISYRVHLN